MSDGDDTGGIVLEARGISKSFPGVRALDRVDLTLQRGRLTALLGENGAGKSTLMNIVAGVLPPDEGEVVLGGEPVRFANPREALAAGIAMIHQELNLVPNMTVAENIFLGREPMNGLGFVDRGRMRREASALLERLDLDVAPETPVSQLRVGQQQVVEIAKAISCDARVVIMDEPTSAITEHETEVLFGIIGSLKAEGVAIAYITHKLEELTRIGDDAVVMRDGHLVGAAALRDLDRDGIVRMMVGREIARGNRRERRGGGPGDEVLRVEGLSLAHPERAGGFVLRDISFRLRRGEVLGIFGLMGAGRTELLEALFGLHPKSVTGRVFLHGEPVELGSPADAIARGLALAPEDRKREGLVLGMSVAENATLASLGRLVKFGLVDEAAERELVGAAVERFGIKTPSVSQAVVGLSGGNQQKVVLAKWVGTGPEILLLDEPTRGIDVRAKAEVYALIDELVAAGLAVVVVSSELPEVLEVSDRVIVLSEGRLTAEFEGDELEEEPVMSAALPA